MTKVTKTIWFDGEIGYFKKGTGIYHREDGPAIITLGKTKYWLQHGQLHRTDGPAVEYVNGDKRYHLDGKQFTEEEYYSIIKQ